VDKQGRTVGPKTVSELKPLYTSKAISEKTFIWNGTSVDKWTTIKKVPTIYTQLKQSNSSGTSKLSLLQRVKTPKAFHLGSISSHSAKPSKSASKNGQTQARHHQQAQQPHTNHTKNKQHTKNTGTRKFRSNSKPIPLTSSSSALQARPLPIVIPKESKKKRQHNDGKNNNPERNALCQKSKDLRDSNGTNTEPVVHVDAAKPGHSKQQKANSSSSSKTKTKGKHKDRHHRQASHGREEEEKKSAVNHLKASKSLDSLHCTDCADHHKHGGHMHGVSSAAAKKRERQGGNKQAHQPSLTVVTKPALRVTRNRDDSAVSTESTTVSTGFAGSGGAAYYYTADPCTPPSTRSYLQPTPFTYGQHLAPNQPANATDSAVNIKSFHPAKSTSDGSQEEEHEQTQQDDRYSSVSADDIDQILDEIEKNEQKQQALRAKIHRIARTRNMMMVPTMDGLRQSKSTPAEIERHEHVNAQTEGSQEDEDNYEEDEELKQETLQRTDSGNTTQSAPVAVAKLIPFKHRSKIDINWDELTAVHFQHENINAIRKIIGQRSVDINTRNPRDGTTLLMHAIIIGDLGLVEEICRVPSINILIRDNDGDDAIDYALIFQRYKVTHLLLMMKHGLTQKALAKLIESKRREAEFMRHNTFGKFQHNMIQFVVKAIRERKPFDINLLFFAWYFVNHGVDKINATNPFPDPLNSIFFKAVMKCYAHCTKHKSKNKRDWYWLRRHVIDSIMWLLPHPDDQHPLYKPDRVKVNMTVFDDESETSDGDGAEYERECSYSLPLSTASFDSTQKDVLPISPTGHAKGDLVSGGGENLLSFLFL